MRTINLLGRGTTAAYLGCELSSEGWGVLSSDVGQDCRLAAVNSRVTITGRSGYGAYAIGDATERFLGCEFDVADYAAVVRGGTVFRTGEAVFLNKGQAVRITVDGFGRAAGSSRSCR
ncbi:hypothetical protein ACFYS8_32890 [Kitasatospora sp. NPDC004615]|uniref:hypothetical protein n=1 Tax=Kitasatospora sp. NPDC004615 TaxID=3364017 RepID=UPI0036D1F1C4